MRTLTEHVWGEIEHILGYKPGQQTSLAVRRQFQIISWQLSAIDEHFNLLLDQLEWNQEKPSYESGSTLNAGNLTAVLREIGIRCAQREINNLLNILSSRGIATVGALTAVATERNMKLVRETFQRRKNRVPDHSEMVASLAAIGGITDEAEAVSAIEVQINFLDTWMQLKGPLAAA